jgi:hypothetical protein
MRARVGLIVLGLGIIGSGLCCPASFNIRGLVGFAVDGSLTPHALTQSVTS